MVAYNLMTRSNREAVCGEDREEDEEGREEVEEL